MTTSDEMGNFCHDNYDHPLLWCEEKKRQIERKNAEESLRMWRRRKAEEMARKEREKHEYYELFLKHHPWGRPGGGAPNVDVRRKDITAIGLHSTPTVGAQRLASLPTCHHSDYFMQHHKKCHETMPTAKCQPQHHPTTHHHHHHLIPRVTTHVHKADPPCPGVEDSHGGTANAESLQITLKDHPSMSFRNKGHVDIEVRYKPLLPGKGKPLLEKIVVTETDKCPLAEIVPVQAARICKSPLNAQKKKQVDKQDKPSSKEPWGKPGPGGKPWRSPKAVGNTFMKSLGWTNKEMLKEIDKDNPVTPAEKQTFRKVRPNKKLQRCCEMCTCMCPAMMASSMQKKPQQSCLSPPKAGQSFSENKAANTATTTATATTIATATKSKPHDMKQKFCPRFMRRCHGALGDVTSNQTAEDTSATGGGVELVPLLARRRANNRPISLSSTDVTKRTPSHDRLSTAADLRYLHDLNDQIAQKRRSISLSKQIDNELSNQHFQTFDQFWGRPGHGAPTDIKTKLNLDNLLYGFQSCTE